jgi:hypothetical protein
LQAANQVLVLFGLIENPRWPPAGLLLLKIEIFVIFYQNITNLHNRYKSAERKISQKNPEYMLNYSLPCSRS